MQNKSAGHDQGQFEHFQTQSMSDYYHRFDGIHFDVECRSPRLASNTDTTASDRIRFSYSAQNTYINDNFVHYGQLRTTGNDWIGSGRLA